jgi:hypothetical protein
VLKRLILKWLGLSDIAERQQTLENTMAGFNLQQAKFSKRFEEVARHFVIRNESGAVTHSLADQYADEDGRDRPGPINQPRGQWATRRRMLEATHAKVGKGKN